MTLPRIAVTRKQASDLLDSLNVLGKQGTTVNTTEQPNVAPGDCVQVCFWEVASLPPIDDPMGMQVDDQGLFLRSVAVGTVVNVHEVYDDSRTWSWAVTLTDLRSVDDA